MNIPENILGTLTDEQKKKIEAAQSPEELLAIAKETGYELTDEQLSRLSGGGFWKTCNDNKHDSIIR
jgi:predicted ribosomally synthesized peptide with nif11-like leader